MLLTQGGIIRRRAQQVGSATGTGVGTAWITSALQPQAGVTVITVEKDPGIAALAAQGDWPGFVELRCADALAVLGEAGRFDLIFADAQGGKWDAQHPPSLTRQQVPGPHSAA